MKKIIFEATTQEELDELISAYVIKTLVTKNLKGSGDLKRKLFYDFYVNKGIKKVSELAEKLNVSRQYVYLLKNELNTSM